MSPIFTWIADNGRKRFRQGKPERVWHLIAYWREKKQYDVYDQMPNVFTFLRNYYKAMR